MEFLLVKIGISGAKPLFLALGRASDESLPQAINFLYDQADITFCFDVYRLSPCSLLGLTNSPGQAGIKGWDTKKMGMVGLFIRMPAASRVC